MKRLKLHLILGKQRFSLPIKMIELFFFLTLIFRDMLEDITKELDNESNMFDCIPRRNIDLEPFDYQILNYCQLISMKDDTFSTLCKGN